MPHLQLAGVATNLAAGLMGAKWGIRYTLLTGLCLQLVGIGMLFGWQVGAGGGGRGLAVACSGTSVCPAMPCRSGSLSPADVWASRPQARCAHYRPPTRSPAVHSAG